MSKETLSWLNNNVLIGFTEKRGQAWHYRASDQGDEPNHYVGAVPIEDVRRRLFNWKPVEGTSETTWTELTEDGVTQHHIVDPTRKQIVRPDTGDVLGVFRPGFKIHDYDEWLLGLTQTIADSDLDIGSAGLLRLGAIAWVQFEFPESLQAEGIAFRPFITAATALDGTLSSTFQTGVGLVVCDNTLSAALGERTARIKVPHSRNSLGRLTEVRTRLGIQVQEVADEMDKELRALCAIPVTEKQWGKFLDELAPMPEEPEKHKRSAKSAERKRDELNTLWKSDERANVWHGTAFGALAAVNTWQQHFQKVRNMERAERNALDMVQGKHDREDAKTLRTLQKVLALAA